MPADLLPCVGLLLLAKGLRMVAEPERGEPSASSEPALGSARDRALCALGDLYCWGRSAGCVRPSHAPALGGMDYARAAGLWTHQCGRRAVIPHPHGCRLDKAPSGAGNRAVRR